jgi:putative FmdB family regulatory protein
MPLYDYQCHNCGKVSEILIMNGSNRRVVCPSCGAEKMERLMSATSSLTGKAAGGLPGPGDSTCCGSSPGQAGCAGPGSCCGRNFS